MRIILTAGGKRRMAERLNAIRAEFAAIVADMPAALESGDTSGWHDNFAFEDNQRRQHQLARRLRDLERVYDMAELIEPWAEAPERVFVGVSVTWRFTDEAAGTPRETWIAGYDDGDPPSGRISYDSPMGRALLGAEEGDVRSVTVAGVQRHVEVIELGPTPAAEADLAEAV